MTVCRFYQQGNCRYGNACKFEHPPKGGQQQNYNRFGALSEQPSQSMAGRGAATDTPHYPGLTVEVIQRDLTSELPTWILSCYGPGRDAPEQLWGGYPREQCFEEIRLHFMAGVTAGNPQGALNDIQALHQRAQEQIQHTVNNIPMAIQYIVEAGNKHPNRIDRCKEQTGGAGPGGAFGNRANAFQTAAPPSNPFGAPAAPQTTPSSFGQTAALGQKPSPFGAPAFGQPAQPTAPAFGQPAALGGATAFGKPAQTTGAFGQSSTLGAKPNPFGAPALSQPAKPAGPSFGQSAFGQPAALGAKPNPFGAPSGGGAFAAATQPAPAASPFGQPAQQPQNAPLPFGQTASSQPASNPFGQPATASPFGQPATAASANPFGQPATAAGTTWGQQQKPAGSPFGATAAATAPANPFGQPTTTSPFGAPAAAPAAATTAPSAPNPFGQPAPGASTATTATAAAPPAQGSGAGSGSGPYGPSATRQHPDISTYGSHNPDKTLRMFKGKPVMYVAPKDGQRPVPMIRNFDGSMVRVWMPNGAPAYTDQTEAEPAKYEDSNVMQQWKAFVETGRFSGGVMPEVPPKREFCLWDF
ncbi:hypothetical protein N658DRAFT_496543 [Parathielavia hyrcaniae]|uniref:C3H1-type domain-containing protein n=1 Tax=Parathielavia hyrcaniae TaxID=113614 RepID=A0AAN6T247_9PEZI|nr:hypothetical protein N658DRAFT_496543 [Parathielavia hyrcaniae]